MDANGIASRDPKLVAVLARLCERLGSINITQASKLPYLVDVGAQEVLGHRITSATFETWRMGVVTREAWNLAKKSDGDGLFEISREGSDEETRGVIRLRPGYANPLSSDELAVVDYIADRFGGCLVEELGSITKTMNAVLPSGVWGQNHEALVDEGAFFRMSDHFRDCVSELRRSDTANRKHWKKLESGREALRASLGY